MTSAAAYLNRGDNEEALLSMRQAAGLTENLPERERAESIGKIDKQISADRQEAYDGIVCLIRKFVTMRSIFSPESLGASHSRVYACRMDSPAPSEFAAGRSFYSRPKAPSTPFSDSIRQEKFDNNWTVI